MCHYCVFCVGKYEIICISCGVPYKISWGLRQIFRCCYESSYFRPIKRTTPVTLVIPIFTNSSFFRFKFCTYLSLALVWWETSAFIGAKTSHLLSIGYFTLNLLIYPQCPWYWHGGRGYCSEPSRNALSQGHQAKVLQHQMLQAVPAAGEYDGSERLYHQRYVNQHTATLPPQLCHGLVRFWAYQLSVCLSHQTGTGTLSRRWWSIKRNCWRMTLRLSRTSMRNIWR